MSAETQKPNLQLCNISLDKTPVDDTSVAAMDKQEQYPDSEAFAASLKWAEENPW